MGIKSTYDIDRTTAILVIVSKIHSASNEALAEMLEAFPESHFRNYNVQDSLQDYNHPRAIQSLPEFESGR